MPIKIDQIDHVELVVPSRKDAADWYGDALGMKIVSEFEFWANDPKGPLMISTPNGKTKIAFFRGQAKGSMRDTGFHLLAFRTDARNFLRFLDELDSLSLRDRDDQAVGYDSVIDHDFALSIYFCDPWRNEIELTTYEHQEVRQRIADSDSI